MEHDLSHWFSDKQSRLTYWREWRQTLTSLDQKDLLSAVADWWKFVPLVNKTLDPWRVDTWPNPWELIGAGEFCASAQGLGIFYTLTLLGHDPELVLAQLPDYDETRLLVVIDEEKVLNYVDGEAVDVEKAKVEPLNKWRSSDLARLVKV